MRLWVVSLLLPRAADLSAALAQECAPRGSVEANVVQVERPEHLETLHLKNAPEHTETLVTVSH